MKKIIALILFAIWFSAGLAATAVLATMARGDTYISPEYVRYCEEIGERYHIQPEFIESFIEAESSGVPTASNGNCKGLMQVYEAVHRDRMKRLGVTNLYDPYQNILVGTDILVELFERYEDDTALIVAMYNGQSDARRRTENFDFAAYTKKFFIVRRNWKGFTGNDGENHYSGDHTAHSIDHCNNRRLRRAHGNRKNNLHIPLRQMR